MKKVFLTIALLLGLTMTTSANGTSMLTAAAGRLDAMTDSAMTLRYDMELNDKMLPMRRSFLLDDKQSDMLFDFQKGVAEGFAHLNELTDSTARSDYFSTLIKYWHDGAKMSFYITERTDAPLMYRKYWNCVNVTLRNKGYIDDSGRFSGK